MKDEQTERIRLDMIEAEAGLRDVESSGLEMVAGLTRDVHERIVRVAPRLIRRHPVLLDKLKTAAKNLVDAEWELLSAAAAVKASGIPPLEP